MESLVFAAGWRLAWRLPLNPRFAELAVIVGCARPQPLSPLGFNIRGTNQIGTPPSFSFKRAVTQISNM